MLLNWWRDRAQSKKIGACPHEWHKVGEGEIETYNSFDSDLHESVIMYCPVCNSSKEVYAEEVGAILKMQEVRENYYS